MRIAQLVNNFRKTTPTTNNSIYSHTSLLANGLNDRDNIVTLFASGDSETKGGLVSVTDTNTAEMNVDERVRKNLTHLLISKCYGQAESFDVIHSHFTILSSYYSSLVKIPTLQSIHLPITEDDKHLLRKFKDNNYVSFTLAQRKQMPELNWVANIYHGLDLREFQFNPHPEDYFLYLGRIAEDKGLHLAIEAAKSAGVPLLIAGRSYQKDGYWHNSIEKYIDGKQIRYVGEAGFEAKKELLKNAKGLLFPSQVEETFGLSMIEAMASGTPVIAWNKGSVPEVVKDRVTGYIVNDMSGMVKAIKAIDKLKREESRKRVQLFFSADKMVTGYERVYLRLIEEYRTNKKNK
jgi:glycosyltransferase involved in cell wall biosynthesis